MYENGARKEQTFLFNGFDITNKTVYTTFADHFNRNKRFRCDVELYYS